MSSYWDSVDNVFVSAIEYLHYRENTIYAEISFDGTKLFLHNRFGMVRIYVKNNVVKSSTGELSYVDNSFDILESFQTICLEYDVKLEKVGLIR